MDRYPGDYIRQQPEYRYLFLQDNHQEIVTCFEDGEVKLRLSHLPTTTTTTTTTTPRSPNARVARLPQRPRKRSLIRSAASAVYQLTSAQLQRLPSNAKTVPTSSSSGPASNDQRRTPTAKTPPAPPCLQEKNFARRDRSTPQPEAPRRPGGFVKNAPTSSEPAANVNDQRTPTATTPPASPYLLQENNVSRGETPRQEAPWRPGVFAEDDQSSKKIESLAEPQPGNIEKCGILKGISNGGENNTALDTVTKHAYISKSLDSGEEGLYDGQTRPEIPETEIIHLAEAADVKPQNDQIRPLEADTLVLPPNTDADTKERHKEKPVDQLYIPQHTEMRLDSGQLSSHDDEKATSSLHIEKDSSNQEKTHIKNVACVDSVPPRVQSIEDIIKANQKLYTGIKKKNDPSPAYAKPKTEARRQPMMEYQKGSQHTQPKPIAHSPQPKPTAQSPQPKPTARSPQPKPTAHSSQPEPTADSPQPKPTASSSNKKSKARKNPGYCSNNAENKTKKPKRGNKNLMTTNLRSSPYETGHEEWEGEPERALRDSPQLPPRNTTLSSQPPVQTAVSLYGLGSTSSSSEQQPDPHSPPEVPKTRDFSDCPNSSKTRHFSDCQNSSPGMRIEDSDHRVIVPQDRTIHQAPIKKPGSIPESSRPELQVTCATTVHKIDPIQDETALLGASIPHGFSPKPQIDETDRRTAVPRTDAVDDTPFLPASISRGSPKLQIDGIDCRTALTRTDAIRQAATSKETLDERNAVPAPPTPSAHVDFGAHVDNGAAHVIAVSPPVEEGLLTDPSPVNSKTNENGRVTHSTSYSAAPLLSPVPREHFITVSLPEEEGLATNPGPAIKTNGNDSLTNSDSDNASPFWRPVTREHVITVSPPEDQELVADPDPASKTHGNDSLTNSYSDNAAPFLGPVVCVITVAPPEEEGSVKDPPQAVASQTNGHDNLTISYSESASPFLRPVTDPPDAVVSKTNDNDSLTHSTSDSAAPFLRPVTRVDVVERQHRRTKTSGPTSHLGAVPGYSARCQRHITSEEEEEEEDDGGFRFQKHQALNNQVSPAFFTIPVIVVEEEDDAEAAVDDVSDDDADAVSIDADEYLALMQCVQGEQLLQESEDIPAAIRALHDQHHHHHGYDRHVLSSLTDRVLRRRRLKNSGKMSRLGVPDHLHVSSSGTAGERILQPWRGGGGGGGWREEEKEEMWTRGQSGSDFVRRPATVGGRMLPWRGGGRRDEEEEMWTRGQSEPDLIRRRSTSDSLEAAGLRRPLKPSPYTVEFFPHAALLTYGDALTPTPNPRESDALALTPTHPTASPLAARQEYGVGRRCPHQSSLLRHPPDSPTSSIGSSSINSNSNISRSLRSAMSSRSSSRRRSTNANPGSSTLSHLLHRQVSWAGQDNQDSNNTNNNACDNSKHTSTTTTTTTNRHHISFSGRRHSSATMYGSDAQILTQRFLAERHLLAGAIEEGEESAGWGREGGRGGSSRRQTWAADAEGRKTSTASAPGSRASLSLSHEDLEALDQAQTTQYDPKFEKSERYNHQKENSFNKASQYLTPVRKGLRNVQVHYSKTNTCHNDGLIFAHLLRAAHVRNAVVEEGVYALERRLYSRRHGRHPHATTFYDTHDITSAGKKEAGSATRRGFSPLAKKKRERRERIVKKNNEIEMGYTPTALSLPDVGPEEVEELRRHCRYLRV